MTNRELIEQLSKFPPEAIPYISVALPHDKRYVSVLEVIGASEGDDESVTFIDAK